MPPLQFGIVLPYLDPRRTAELARLAEQAGWDAIFVGDAVWTFDPLISLAAAAAATTRIRLGTAVLVTPLRNPWHLASESLALDHLSGGRLILGLATGAAWMGWHAFPDLPTETRARAEILDETIDILTRLYARQPFDYAGQHFHLRLTALDTQYYPPAPVQQPRIPLWVPAIYPRPKSLRRLLKADGVFPEKQAPPGEMAAITPAELAEIKAYVDANRTLATPFDYTFQGTTDPAERAKTADQLAPWIEAGLTWWIESTWALEGEALAARIRSGPPRE